MNALTHILARSGLLTKDLDYRLIRASMVLIFWPSATRNGSPMRRKS